MSEVFSNHNCFNMTWRKTFEEWPLKESILVILGSLGFQYVKERHKID